MSALKVASAMAVFHFGSTSLASSVLSYMKHIWLKAFKAPHVTPAEGAVARFVKVSFD